MIQELPDGPKKVQEFLIQKGVDWQVEMLPDSTASAQAAADALGISVVQIGKSIVFGNLDATVVAVVGGDKRVDTEKLSKALGMYGLSSLKPDNVKIATGYPIGGVSPFSLPNNVRVVIDEDYIAMSMGYVAAGHPKSVVRVIPEQLVKITSAQVLSIT